MAEGINDFLNRLFLASGTYLLPHPPPLPSVISFPLPVTVNSSPKSLLMQSSLRGLGHRRLVFPLLPRHLFSLPADRPPILSFPPTRGGTHPCHSRLPGVASTSVSSRLPGVAYTSVIPTYPGWHTIVSFPPTRGGIH